MKRLQLSVFVMLSFACPLFLAAQEKGEWSAKSSNAKTITGDIGIFDNKITIALLNFPLAQIRSLETAELTAAFDADPGGAQTRDQQRTIIYVATAAVACVR